MRKILITILAVASMACFAAPTQASVADANRIAQAYQNNECGFGATWLCYNAYTVPQSCELLTSAYYTCVGAFTQQYIVGGLRYCKLDIHVGRGDAGVIYHYDSCRH